MNWKISKRLVTVFMAFMLLLEIPVYAFAEDVPAENAPVEDVQDNTECFVHEPFVEGTGDVQEVQVFEEAGKTQEPEASENLEASVNFETPAAQTVPGTADGSQAVDPNSAGDENVPEVTFVEGNTEFASESVSYGGYTTSIKGLPENSEDILLTFAESIPDSINSGAMIKQIIDEAVDAEKYSIGLPGYDQQMCWAASASDMLWMSGYAQEATNPFTGEKFTSEDDVFEYFRKCFTDGSGIPKAGFEYFFTGEYPNQGQPGLSQLREEYAQYGKLLPDEQITVGTEEQWHDESGDSDILTPINNLNDKSAAALLKWFYPEAGLYLPSAHLLTVAGITQDDAETDFTKKYKGIILSDSDNDPVRVDAYAGDSLEERARLAAAAPNSYTYYNLSWENLGGENKWVVQNYVSVPLYKTVLEGILWLTDRIIPVPEIPYAGNSGEDEHKDDVTTQIPAPINPELDKIKTLMKDNNMLVYSPTVYVYKQESDKEFVLYVSNIRTALVNVFLDGTRLAEDAAYYRIDELPGGLFTIRLSQELMKSLKKGNHELLLDFYTIDDVTVNILVE
jgi:hypothetical protein